MFLCVKKGVQMPELMSKFESAIDVKNVEGFLEYVY